MTATERVQQAPWHEIEKSLWSCGYGSTGVLLTPEECSEIVGYYLQSDLFRSRIDMARYRLGRGEYQYFAYPLPALIQEFRESLYAALVKMARRWVEALKLSADLPGDHSDFLNRCHLQNQPRPTPLLLRYDTGDFNCLHQDLYGELFFPFQVIFSLSEPGRDFQGGELMLVEQHPRSQSVGQVILPKQGEGIVITTRYRPIESKKGYHRANVRHGVSRVRSGQRYTLGIIFHDAS